MKSYGNSSFRLALAFVVAFAALGGRALAAPGIPDSTGVIHSCYSQATGTFRPINTEANPPQRCKSGETELTWNQQGPRGPVGQIRIGATVIGETDGGIDDNHRGFVQFNLAVNGGAAVGAGGAEVSLWCANGGSVTGAVIEARLLTMQVGGFF
jgi:hypothetical protein